MRCNCTISPSWASYMLASGLLPVVGIVPVIWQRQARGALYIGNPERRQAEYTENFGATPRLGHQFFSHSFALFPCPAGSSPITIAGWVGQAF